MVSRVFETPEETLKAALALAEEIGQKSPIAVQVPYTICLSYVSQTDSILVSYRNPPPQGSKLHLNYGRDHSVDESLDYIRVWNSAQLNTEDLVKSALAIMTKEKAEYSDV